MLHKLTSEAGLSNISSYLATAFSVTRFITVLSLTYALNKLTSEAGLSNRNSYLATAFGMTRFITVIAMIMVNL
jgi:hypothetical protein